jgi:magnesium chelatase family protein
VALVGGGNVPRPGEISLAHNGVLFLDELPEFDRRVLEVLRQPLESGKVTISRAAQQADFPARFQLVAAMNPCPCGYLGHPSGKCRCGSDSILRYQARISGPLLDRIDLQVAVSAVPPDILSARAAGDSTELMVKRVRRAHARQMARQQSVNCDMGTQDVDRYCQLDAKGEAKLQETMVKLHWSARAYQRVLKVARTLADLDDADNISHEHVSTAIEFRRGLRPEP